MLGNRGNVAVLMELSSRSERSGISTALRERVWGQAAKRTVRAVTVVVFSPHRAMGSCMAHAVEFLQCKQFVSQPTVEASLRNRFAKGSPVRRTAS